MREVHGVVAEMVELKFGEDGQKGCRAIFMPCFRSLCESKEISRYQDWGLGYAVKFSVDRLVKEFHFINIQVSWHD